MVRDPDLVQIIGDLQDRLKALEANTVSRWGRVPHVAADPATLVDGMDWIRSDTGEWRYRANGATVALDSRYAPVTLGVVARAKLTAPSSANAGNVPAVLSAPAFTALAGRRYKITVYAYSFIIVGVGTETDLNIFRGATQIAGRLVAVAGPGTFPGGAMSVEDVPGAGSVTYTLGTFTNATTVQINAAATLPYGIIVEDIGV